MSKLFKRFQKWFGRCEGLEDVFLPFCYIQLLGGLSPIVFTPYGKIHIASAVALLWTVALQTLQIYVTITTLSEHNSNNEFAISPVLLPVFYGCRITSCCTIIAIPILRLLYCRVMARLIKATNEAARSVEELGIIIDYTRLKIRAYTLLFIWSLFNTINFCSDKSPPFNRIPLTIFNCTLIIVIHFYMITYSLSHFLKLSNDRLSTGLSKSDVQELGVIVVTAQASVLRARRRKRLGKELAGHSLVHLRTHAACELAASAFGTTLLASVFIWLCFTPFSAYLMVAYLSITSEWTRETVRSFVFSSILLTHSTFCISLSVSGIAEYATQFQRMQEIVNDMRNAENDYSDMLEQELDHLAFQLRQMPPKFSACGVMNLNYRSLLSLVKIVLTYFIIMMQYQKTIEIKAFIRNNTN